MKIIKRSGTEVQYDLSKIVIAIQAANKDVEECYRLDEDTIFKCARNVERECREKGRILTVEEVQDLVENQLMNEKAFEVARKYITYRYRRALARKANTTDQQILTLIECNNQDVKEENSNKNPPYNLFEQSLL